MWLRTTVKRLRRNVGGIGATLTMEADTTLSVEHRGPCKGDLLPSDENINGWTGCLNFKSRKIQHFASQNLQLFPLIKPFRAKFDCGKDGITMAASSPEGQLIREPAELTWNRGGDVNTTEKVICSPWIHPSGIQQHKPNLPHHQHIINPHTSLYWKNLMNARLQKQ